jgi:hypothetical protein
MAPPPQAVSESRIAHTMRGYRSRVCALFCLRLCCEVRIQAFRSLGPQAIRPQAISRMRRFPFKALLFNKMRRSRWSTHAARGTRRMTLERVRSGFLRIGIRVRSRVFIVWSELLTPAPEADNKRLFDAFGSFTQQMEMSKFLRQGLSTSLIKREPECLVVSFAQTQVESGPIVSVWVTLMPDGFLWRFYVRYGCGGNNSCDSGGRVARASRVKRFF